MTDRHRAAGARIVAAGTSTATTLALVTALSLAAPVSSDTAPPPSSIQKIRVVVTDPAIPTDVALNAALEAVRDGRTRVTVPVGQTPAPPPPATSGVPVPETSHAPHTVTRAS